MENIKYKKEDIQKALQLINSLNTNGVHNASSIVQIFNILNNPIIESEENNDNKKLQYQP